jgi:S-adenosylmethionine:tRNA ribosyltransferase-isomerase
MAAPGLIADFQLSADLEAAEPPEARGLDRDQVRLLVSDIEADSIEHAQFRDLPRWLSPGDLLVVNTSGTLNAALPATSEDGEFEIHLSTRLPGGFWSVEVRRPGAVASHPYPDARAGTSYRLPADGKITLLAPYPLIDSVDSRSRLWMAALQLPSGLVSYLDEHGSPIRYSYVPRAWPGSTYQTIFASEPGSAEMPSAGRPFTPALVTRLVSRGIEIAPLMLHTGVASLENHEPPYEEYYSVPPRTAERVTAARRAGRRVIAVGTTVVRALETVTGDDGTTYPGKGWTDLVITRESPLRSVTGLISGFHEPRATHLAFLERLCGVSHLERAYAEARRLGYLWHEFGDSHLIFAAAESGGHFSRRPSASREPNDVTAPTGYSTV